MYNEESRDDRMLINIEKKFASLGSEWESYIQFIEIKSFIEASYCLRNIQISIISILACIDQACATEKDDLFLNVDIVPEIIEIIENDISILYIMQEVQKQDDTIDGMFPWDELTDDEYPVDVMALLFDAMVIKKQIDVLGVTTSTFLVIQEENASWQEKIFAKAMLSIYRKVLYFGKVEKIYSQIGKLKKSAEERDSSDCTTRLQIIFSLHNNDKYILRVDMPHKGQPIVHINMNESVRGENYSKIAPVAFPFLDESDIFKKISFLGNDISKLFYRQGHMIWFRVKFKRKVEQVVNEESKKRFLYELYDDRCHYSELWKEIDLQEKTVLSFFDRQCNVLRKMNLNNFNELYFEKSDREIIEVLGKLGWIDNFIHIMLEKIYNEDKNISHLSIKRLLWIIFDKAKEHDIMWQGRVLTKEMFVQEDLLNICKWLMEI